MRLGWPRPARACACRERVLVLSGDLVLAPLGEKLSPARSPRDAVAERLPSEVRRMEKEPKARP
jgi:hypothetical protein